MLKNMKNKNNICCKAFLITYAVDIGPDYYLILDEFVLWQDNIKTNPIKTVLNAINECNEQIYPTICRIIITLPLLPVTTKISKRSFSTLNRFKIYLKNTSKKRLNGLSFNEHSS